MTYRRESEIVASYVSFTRRVVPDRTWEEVRLAKCVPIRRSRDVQDADEAIATKSHMSAQFVSNCNTHSKREAYLAQLSKEIDVDVFGACGKLKCPRYSNQCDEMLNSKYW